MHVPSSRFVFFLIFYVTLLTLFIQPHSPTDSQVFTQSVDHSLLGKTQLLSELGCSNIAIGAIFRTCPGFFTHSIDAISQRISYFLSLGVKSKDIPRLLRLPAWAHVNLEHNIKPKIERIKSTLGISNENICELVTMRPGLLAHTWRAFLEHNWPYLQRRGVSGESALRMTFKCPALVQYDMVHVMEERQEYFEKLYPGINFVAEFATVAPELCYKELKHFDQLVCHTSRHKMMICLMITAEFFFVMMTLCSHY